MAGKSKKNKKIKIPKTVMQSFFSFYLFCMILLCLFLALSFWKRKEYLTPLTLRAYAYSVINKTDLDGSKKEELQKIEDKRKAADLEKEQWIQIEEQKSKAKEAVVKLLDAYASGKLTERHLDLYYQKAKSYLQEEKNTLTHTELVALTSYSEELHGLKLPDPPKEKASQTESSNEKPEDSDIEKSSSTSQGSENMEGSKEAQENANDVATEEQNIPDETSESKEEEKLDGLEEDLDEFDKGAEGEVSEKEEQSKEGEEEGAESKQSEGPEDSSSEEDEDLDELDLDEFDEFDEDSEETEER